MAPIVQVEHVYKKYSRNANAHLNYGMRDLYNHLLGRKPSMELRKDEFFAVNDVSFSLERGDTLALIGRNGSGKSTLLKMLNGLIKLDAGRIVMDGRVQALINLGAGFNGALSGMDNIYNSAALYGFNRKQTKAIADEIIDFAELDEFINSPVETYSSGMKARLGFAVAVHLKPDILLIDEILAVGDYAFQNRCFARMQQLKKNGVTIVLVSHAHNNVIQLCERAVWLHQGKPMVMGEAPDAVKAYLAFLDSLETRKATQENEKRKEALQAQSRKHEKKAVARKKVNDEKKKQDENLYGPIHTDLNDIRNLQVHLECDGESVNSIGVHNPLTVVYSFELCRPVADLNVTLKFFRKDGLHLTTVSTLNGDLIRAIHEGRVDCRLEIPDFDFNPGTYVLVIAVHEGKSYLYRNVAAEFAVVGKDAFTWGIRDFKYRYLSAGITIFDSTAGENVPLTEDGE